jgi:hypothetical protein
VASQLKVKWLDEAEEKDYSAAHSYLSLLVPGGDLDRLIEELKKAPVGTLASQGHPPRGPAAAARRQAERGGRREAREDPRERATVADHDRHPAPRLGGADR